MISPYDLRLFLFQHLNGVDVGIPVDALGCYDHLAWSPFFEGVNSDRVKTVLQWWRDPLIQDDSFLAVCRFDGHRSFRGAVFMGQAGNADFVIAVGRNSEFEGRGRTRSGAGITVSVFDVIFQSSSLRPFSSQFCRIIVDDDASDLAEGVEYAKGLLPDVGAHRILLVSDGNETAGSLLEAASRAAGQEKAVSA